MSFYFGDTFTGTDATQIITKWNGAGAWRLGGPQNSGGRSGGWCMVMFDSGNLFYIPHTTSTGWIIATAVKPGNVQRAFIFSFGTNDGTGYQQLLFVGLNALGGISIYGPNVSGFNPLLYSSANGIYLANTWGHLAAKVSTSFSSGSLSWTCTIQWNSVTVLSGATGSSSRTVSTINELGIDYNCGGVQDYFNDCYIVNTSDGVPPTDFPGDLRSIALFPVSPAGSESGWTPSNGSGPNYLMVNEKPNDGDVTFVTTNSNVTDTYHFPVIALPTGSHIFGIQNNVVARKDESGERKISSVCRPGSGTDYVGTPVSNPNYVDLSIGDSYATYPWMWNHNPDTGNDWLESEYNNTQFGEKCTL